MIQSSLPDWVSKYKAKGYYITKKGEFYYLYKGHNEYNKETKKAKRVTDCYIGRITKEDGLIYSRVAKEDYEVYTYGRELFCLSYLDKNYVIPKSFHYYSNVIKIAGILLYLYGSYKDIVELTYFSLKKITFNKVGTLVKGAIDHVFNYLTKELKDIDLSSLRSLYLLKSTSGVSLSSIRDDAKELLNTYGVNVNYGN
jgi:hypothetical protein